VTAQGGEVNTLVDIYSKHERRIYRYCLSLLRNPDDAEDATQETFTRAAPFLPNLAGDLSAYLTTVARNICCDVVRARSRRPVPIDNVALPDRAVSPERQSVDWDVVRRMWRQLTPSERLLFAYTFAGYRYEEIATRTGMSRPSVSVGLTRARRRLRDLATAIGALGLLPVGLRRLLDRASQRAQAVMASGQQALIAVAEQAGAITAGLLAGLVTIAAGGTAAASVAAPAMAAAGYRVAGGAQAVAAAPVGAAGELSASAAHTESSAARPVPPPAPPRPFAPAADQAVAVLPGGTATPNDAMADSVTPSPRFSQDGIAFMSGEVLADCASGAACPAAFRTGDAGRSWTRVWASTYHGGNILLTPHFPADPTVFVLDVNTGLLAAPAGDGAFTTVVPQATAAAVAPDSATGRARAVAVSRGGVVSTYAIGDKAPTPGPALPAGMTAGSVVFTSPDHVVVGGWRLHTDATGKLIQDAAVVECTLSLLCGTPIAFPQYSSVDVVSTGAYGSPVVAYATGGSALLSRDAGASFQPLLTPPTGQVLRTVGMGAAARGTRIVFSWSPLPNMRAATVSYTDDFGATVTDVTGDLNAGGYAIAATALGNGNLLVGLSADLSRHFALRESTGNGHWGAPSAF
jgi:RNA polymerase sigma factor (sigma-70 family)